MSQWIEFVWRFIVVPIGLICGWARGADENLKTVGGVVKLPPFVVEQSQGAAWKYVELPDAEVLARCSEATTARLAMAFSRAQRSLDAILPKRFQLKLDVPRVMIFYDEKLWLAARQEMVTEITRLNPNIRAQEFETAESPSRQDDLVPDILPPGLDIHARAKPQLFSRSFFTNLQLTDADSIMIFAKVSGEHFDPYDTHLTPEYVAELVNGRTPPLPEWFSDGFLTIYPHLEFSDDGISFRVPVFSTLKAARLPQDHDLAPTKGVFPLNELLRGRSGQSDIDALKRIQEAELFVSWGIDPSGNRTEAFWRFLDRSCTGFSTEEDFQACFGFGFEEAAKKLAIYNREPHTLRWQFGKDFAKSPALAIRDASLGEIARIKGEWERLETRYVKKNLPDLETTYYSQARRTLHRAFDAGDRDPQLLASLGLLELDAGDTREGRGFLEAATSRGVVRPRAYFELARLLYDEKWTRSRRNDGRLQSDDAKTVMNLLIKACGQSPPLQQIYELMADVAVNSVSPAPAAVLASLEKGAELFPEDIEFLSRIVRLYSAEGLQDRADEMLRRRLKTAANIEVRDVLLKLRAGLKSSAVSR